MKLWVSLFAVVVVGALAAGLAVATHASPSGLMGVVVSTLTGVCALVLKASLAHLGSNGLKNLKVQLGSLGVSFALRLFAVGAGFLVLRARGEAVEPFLLSFFACYVAQQVIEVRYVLGVAPRRAPAIAENSGVGR